MFIPRANVPRHHRINPFYVGIMIFLAVDLADGAPTPLTAYFIIRACVWIFRNAN